MYCACNILILSKLSTNFRIKQENYAQIAKNNIILIF